MKSYVTVFALLSLTSAWDEGIQQMLGREPAPAPTPAPTPAPGPAHVKQMLARVATSSETCGWISGLLAEPVTCSAGRKCVFNSAYSNAGCCFSSSISCAGITQCYDGTDVTSLTLRSDPLAIACTASAAPYCVEYVYNEGFTALGCGSVSIRQTVSTSLLGLDTTTTGVTISVSFAGNAAVASGAAVSGGSGSSGSSGNNSGDAGGSSNSGNGGGSSSGNNGGSALSTGAIVGIAVAAAVVAVAAIIAIGIICWKRSKRPSVVTHQQQPLLNEPKPPPGASADHYGHAPVGSVPSGSPPPMSHAGTPGPQASVVGASSATHSGTTGAGSQVGSSTASQPMTQANMNAMLAAHQSGEWAFVQKPVSQMQSAAADNDGIKATEIMPDDAIDEQKPQQVYHAGSPTPFPQHPGSPSPFPQHPGSPGAYAQHPGSPPPGAYYQQGHYPGTVVTSNVAPTAFAPTVVSHNVQNV